MIIYIFTPLERGIPAQFNTSKKRVKIHLRRCNIVTNVFIYTKIVKNHELDHEKIRITLNVIIYS